MGLLDKVADWFGRPPPHLIQCQGCGTQFDEIQSSCPECGDDLMVQEAPYEMYHGPM